MTDRNLNVPDDVGLDFPMFRKLIFAAASTAIAFSPVPSAAQEKTSNHTLASGSDTWRIELRNLEQFLAMSVGDSDGISELRYIDISLSGPEGQFHKVQEVNPFISINGGPRSLRNTIDVRIGDRVNLERLEPGTTNTYDLWIHAKERTQGDLGPPVLNFEIKVAARELDCVRDRVCRRGSTGTITYFVSLPKPQARYSECNAQNTYQISAVNGASMVLQPRNARAPRGQIDVRSDISNQHSLGLTAQGSRDATRLAMQSGQICIASTTR